jgi:hypothetical protein
MNEHVYRWLRQPRKPAPAADGTTPVNTPRPPDPGSPPDEPFINDYRQRILDRFAPLLTIGAPLGAAALAPAAALIPSAVQALNASEQYGDAGGAVAGASALAGGVGGIVAGRATGDFLSGARGNRFGLRTGGGVLGALIGSAAGGMGGGLVNTGAAAAVNRAQSGEPGVMADVGRALDAIGYRSASDMERARLNQMYASPAYQALEAQKELASAKRRNDLLEQVYLASLAQGAMGG